MGMAEFKGEVIAKLENIEKSQKHNSEQHKEFYDRIRKLEKRPVGSIGAVIAFILRLVR